jgi:uncharacterized protein YkwD
MSSRRPLWVCTTVLLRHLKHKHAILNSKMVLTHIPKPKQSAHDKKRQGQHHKSSKHYTKTYWPYLPMLLVVLCGFLINITWSAGKSVLGYATNVSVTSLLQDTNTQRDQNGKSALASNSLLNQAAQAKANDMANRNYWSHNTPEGKQPWQFISDVGYTYMSAGENLAYGFDDSSATVAGWMNSPPHKANLLNNDYTEVGFGIANSADYQGDGEETIVVAMYAKPQKVVTPQSATTGRAPESKAQATPTEQIAPTEPAQETEPTAPAESTPTDESKEATPVITSNEPVTQTLPAKEVARIDVLTNGNAQWAALAVSILATVAIAAFIYKHAKYWRKALVKGEQFFIHHPVLDTIILAVGVIGVILTQTSGFIH